MTINRRGLFGFFAAAPAIVVAASEPSGSAAVLNSLTAHGEALTREVAMATKWYKAKVILTFDDSYPSEFVERSAEMREFRW